MKEEKKQLRLKMALFVLLPLCLAVKAQGASFDCGKAATKVEKIICADSELSKLDEELAVSYKTALQDKKQADPIRLAQKQWLKERNGCDDATCVKQAYDLRLHGLPVSAVMNSPSEDGAATQQDSTPSTVKPLYGHCVDLETPTNCGEGKSGKGYTVCEIYLKYLNSLSKIPRCEVPKPPSFQRPDWEEVDVMQHLDWAYQAEAIRFDWFGVYRNNHPDFATWQKEFFEEKQAGKIVPAMRKTRVKPLGEKEITILAYTRHREGCLDVVRKISKGSFWADVGYLHFLLLDVPDAPLVEIPVRNYGIFQTEMLIYAGRPYFVEVYDSATHDTPSIGIFAFDPKLPTQPEKNEYWVMKLCSFSPVDQQTRK